MMRLVTSYVILNILLSSAVVSHARRCTVIADCFLKIQGSCDGYANSTMLSLPDICNVIVRPSCQHLFILQCLLNDGDFSWCYWCGDRYSDCFGRWLELCAIGRQTDYSSVEGGKSRALSSVCVSCSELMCCKAQSSEQEGSNKGWTQNYLLTTSISTAGVVSKYLLTLESESTYQRTTPTSATTHSVLDVGKTSLKTSDTCSGELHTGGTTQGVTPSETEGAAATSSQKILTATVVENYEETADVGAEDYSVGGKVFTSTENFKEVSNGASEDILHLASNSITADSSAHTPESILPKFSTVNNESHSPSYVTGTEVKIGDLEISNYNFTATISVITFEDTNAKESTNHTSNSATSNAFEIASSKVGESTNGVPSEELSADEEMRKLCESPHCPSSDCYFKGHCYLVRKLEDSYLEGRTGDQTLSEVCDVIRPGAVALAVQSEEEVDYVARLLKYQGANGSVLTSGVRHCCSCNISDSWTNWYQEVNSEIINMVTNATNTTCITPAFYVINDGYHTGELTWGLTSGKADAMPSYVVCETQSRYHSSSTSLAATTTSRRPPPTQRQPPPPPRSPPPRPPPPRPESLSRCYSRCRQTDMYGYTWSSPCGMYQRRRCPTENPGFAWWYCRHDGHFWGMQPFYGECYHTWVVEAKSMVSKNVPAGDIVLMVQELAVNQSFFGHEIPDLLDVLNATCALHANQTSGIVAVGARLNSSKAFTGGVTAALGNLLQSNTSWMQLDSIERVLLGAQLLNLSDEVGFSLAAVASELGPNTIYRVAYDLSDLHMEVQVTEGGQPIAFPSSGEREQEEVHVLVSGEAVLRADQHFSVGVIIRGLPASFLFPPYFYTAGDNDSSEQLSINSAVVSFSVADHNDSSSSSGGGRETSAAVVLELRHVVEARGPEEVVIRRKLFAGETPSAVKGSAKCVYWNASLGENGLWDDWGCRVVSSNATHTTCACEHLSTFSVLMDVHDYVGKDTTLQALSLACSGASVLCLLLTLIVFHGCRSIQSERTSIGKNMCVCLLIAHVLTLSMMDRTFFNLSDSLCSVVAVFLHYFFLASFCWMWVEGHYLYRLVVRVFDSGRNLWRAYMLFGFGFPALVISVTEVVAQLCGDKAYGRDELCWLTSPIYVWAFMGPVLIITVLNGSVVVMAMRAAVSAGMGQGKTRLGKVGVWLKGWFSLCSLLGVTWLFGIGFMEYLSTFEYVFVILNGCQGVFIFLFRCLLNTQVRRSVLNEARQRASVKRFHTSSTQRSSWYITSHSAATRQPSTNTLQEDSATTAADIPADQPPKYSDAVWNSVGSIVDKQSSPSQHDSAKANTTEKIKYI